MSESQQSRSEFEAVRVRAYEISLSAQAGSPEENWLRAERELSWAYDTVDRDLEQFGMTLVRIPLEVGAEWRLELPRGERIEAWEPGNDGVNPPPEIRSLIGGVVAGKELVPAPPVGDDPGAIRLRETIRTQRRSLVEHDPGTRLGEDPENLHQHRVAARRTRAFVRATRRYIDPEWKRLLAGPLGELGRATGPVRDLDVLLEHVRDEVATLDEADRPAGELLVGRLEAEREEARRRLLHALDADAYRTLQGRMQQPPRLAPGVDAIPLGRIARREFRRLLRAVDRLGKQPSDAEIHRLRIKLKRARYAAELAGDSELARDRFLEDAKALQDLLGEHQDAAVAERRLRATSVVDAATAAAFAAGRLAERQLRRRRRVTVRLPRAWKRLRKSGSRLG